MKKTSSFLLSILMFVALGLTFNACVDKDFDEPSADGTDPNIEVTSTVAQIKALHNGTSITDITDDVVIKGVVISNDTEGNFYKEMYIQDETGGIKVALDFTNINADYKEGRNIFIKCKGLKIDKFGELYSLGLGVTDNGRLGRIPENVKEDYIFPGKLNQNITPKVISINDFAGAVGTLVTIEDAQFIDGEAGVVNYADPSTTGGGSGENRTIEDCNNNKVTVRNSDYASFAETQLPAGKGKITGVASAFGTTNQLLIRSTEDVDMAGDRCDGSGGGGNPVDGDLKTIAEIRALFTGSNVDAPANTKIKGIVISDKEGGNLHSKNLVIQDATAGIAVRFAADHSFALNDEVEINVSGVEISEFNGLLQLNNVPVANATKTGTGTVTPVEKTASEIAANLENLESTLVKIKDATISGGATYSGSLTVTDASGTIPMYTRSGATFASTSVPTGTVEIVAIVSQFNDAQINIRNANDVTGGSGGGTGETMKTISEIRALFSGSNTTAPANAKIKGIVISDRAAENIHSRNLVIQDATGGIAVRFSADHSFDLNDEVEVVVSGVEISEYNGLLQLNNVPVTNATKTGTGTVTPVVKTASEIVANLESLESTLVKIVGASISGGTTYGGSLTVTDASGTIPMYTRSGATFASTSVPSGTVTIIAIVSQFNDAQINIRNTSDVQ